VVGSLGSVSNSPCYRPDGPPESASAELTPAEVRAHGRDPHAREAAKNGWRTNLRAARDEAKKSGKPLMVVLRCFD
jgi:hypothetical protein